MEEKVEEVVHAFHMRFFPVCMCSPYERTELNAVDCWEVKGEEEEGGGGCIRAPWPLVPRALDPGKSASSVFFDPAFRAAQWIHCHVNMCISIPFVSGALWEKTTFSVFFTQSEQIKF